MPPVGDDFSDLTSVGRLDQAKLRLPASGLVDPQVRRCDLDGAELASEQRQIALRALGSGWGRRR
nr:hypothetical protein OG409_01360 [Streptomyces sp. NBC_00974]